MKCVTCSYHLCVRMASRWGSKVTIITDLHWNTFLTAGLALQNLPNMSIVAQAIALLRVGKKSCRSKNFRSEPRRDSAHVHQSSTLYSTQSFASGYVDQLWVGQHYAINCQSPEVKNYIGHMLRSKGLNLFNIQRFVDLTINFFEKVRILPKYKTYVQRLRNHSRPHAFKFYKGQNGQ